MKISSPYLYITSKLKDASHLFVLFYLISLIISHTSGSSLFAQSITQNNIIQGTQVQNTDRIKLNEWIFDRLIYRDFLYSQTKKTIIGDSSSMDIAYRHHSTINDFVRFRFRTQPFEDNLTNQTSRFEFIIARQFNKIRFQVDLELNTNAQGNGETVLGPDLDSDDTFVSFNITNATQFIFYPFNFRTDVGDEFNTQDISRIFYVEGSPSTLGQVQSANEQIVSKTISGIEIIHNTSWGNFYGGIGTGSFLAVADSNFDYETNPVSNQWEWREALSTKLGLLMLDKHMRFTLQYVGLDKARETGALIENAISANIFYEYKNLIFESEFLGTKNGSYAFDIDPSTQWFRDDNVGFIPTFTDYSDNKQDWLGQNGQAYIFKIGYYFTEDFIPYLSLAHHSEHFVYNDRNFSAHILRTRRNDLSHGGLNRATIGAYMFFGDISFRPYIEFQQAKNAVFSNSTEVEAQRELADFEKQNFLIGFQLTYSFEGAQRDLRWWF